MQTTANWYLIYTKPRHEKKVAIQLENRGVTHLFPTTSVVKQWHDRKKIVTEPLFASYIFTFIRDSQEFYDVSDMDGVLKYIKFGKEIAVVPPTTIQNLQILMSGDATMEVVATTFQRGQHVVITSGPLCGIRGEIIAYKGCQKILVRISIIMRHILLDVSPDHLQPVGKDAPAFLRQ
ncbi:UpxY family transcription antiterminator [Chitinophaga pendula]|uniref:transcription termination/antitermination protein NusG n=1 Tax=Chitinophaga TaxID=79328 RepID=UPI000BAFF89B|nr:MULTISPECIES: UpxY family transcription antiterminator [Chitinophaga]ASZ13041.1 antitermination protein NusG [Chitinophaga sp. MD30]UCJ09335.1 UpxY family transcription antiterminator [Chitinophaga pendula]